MFVSDYCILKQYQYFERELTQKLELKRLLKQHFCKK